MKTKTLHVPSLGVDFDVLAEDAVIGPAIARGMWEEHETRLFRAHLNPGDRVLDLGANVGWFGVQAVMAGADVHCFEPVPAIADVCEKNLERAMKIGRGKATLHRCAAGSAVGVGFIALSSRNFGDNRILGPSGVRQPDMGSGDMLQIVVERVDDVVRGPFRVIKIDTQGSEWHALCGMTRILEMSPATALLIEYWPYALRDATGIQLLQFLVDRGFTLGKATAAPYPMKPERIQRQMSTRDPVKGGLDLYATRGVPFHVGGPVGRLRALARSLREG
ncbi:MAG: FkbM family methyltransferase [Planctomycetes bacterium]|nr:FkbM family methyltransferase [Planctomycetota bacterium]